MTPRAQYSPAAIAHYEAIYGRDFVSPGGIETARQFINELNLAPRARVLDIGCGLGGCAFVMAKEFGLQVDGMDKSKAMIARARVKLAEHGLEDQVTLREGDCLELDADEEYDAVISRDVFLHIHDKARLFKVIRRALRGGGKLLFSDYCCGEKAWSESFGEYVAARNYCLHTLEDYAAHIARAGFKEVRARDCTDDFVKILAHELRRIAKLDLRAEEIRELQNSWRAKHERAKIGEHQWGWFSACKA